MLSHTRVFHPFRARSDRNQGHDLNDFSLDARCARSLSCFPFFFFFSNATALEHLVNRRAIASARTVYRREERCHVANWLHLQQQRQHPVFLRVRFASAPSGEEFSFSVREERILDDEDLHGSRSIFLRKHGLRQDCRAPFSIGEGKSIGNVAVYTFRIRRVHDDGGGGETHGEGKEGRVTCNTRLDVTDKYNAFVRARALLTLVRCTARDSPVRPEATPRTSWSR